MKRFVILFASIVTSSIMTINCFALTYINASAWAAESVGKAYEYGLIDDYLAKNGMTYLSRKQLALIACNFYKTFTGNDISPKNGSPFTDEASREVAFAFEAGIMKGISNTEFDPESAVTREQMAVALLNTINACGVNIDEGDPSSNSFNDLSKTSYWAQSPVSILKAAGILSGTDGNFDPQGYISVEQCTVAFLTAFEKYRELEIARGDFSGITNVLSDDAQEKSENVEKSAEQAKSVQPQNEVNESNKEEAKPVKQKEVSQASNEASNVKGINFEEPEIGVAEQTDFMVNGVTLSIGDDQNYVTMRFGKPSRIETSGSGYERYIYSSILKDFLIVGIKDKKVVEIFSNSKNFKFKKVNAGTDAKNIKFITSANKKLESYTTNTQDYTAVMRFIPNDKGSTFDSVHIKQIGFDNTVNTYNYDFSIATAQELINLINSVRLRNDLDPLKSSKEAEEVAKQHCNDMAEGKYSNYVNKDGLTPFERLTNAGITYTAASENISDIPGDAIAIYNDWMSSVGTRSNILNPDVTHAGIAATVGDDRLYVTLDMFKP